MQKILVLRLPDVPVFLQSSMVMLPPARRGMPDVLEIMVVLFAVVCFYFVDCGWMVREEWMEIEELCLLETRDDNANTQKFTCSSAVQDTMTTTVSLGAGASAARQCQIISHSKSAQKIRWPASK